MEFLWLPDVFGYSWALPQILKKSGIDVFMTTKISWNQYNRMPHDTFMWKGIDGSEILTHFITTPPADGEDNSWFYTYNGELTPKTVKGVWNSYSEKEINKELLISYGYGDGGGGVNRDALEQRRCIDKIPGLPHLETSTAGDYFRNLKNTIKNTKGHVSTWDGELYLEYHRGTYTSQAYNKLMNRKMELLYRKAEWFAVMKGLHLKDLKEADQEKLTKGWQQILTNQFHDIIPGSSINEVYKDSKKDYELIRNIAEEVESDFYSNALSKDLESDIFYRVRSKASNLYTIVNTSGWKRSDIVKIQTEEEGYYMDTNFNVLSTQREGNYDYVEVENVPSMGFEKIGFHAGSIGYNPSAFKFNMESREIDTPFYLVNLNKNGQISRLYDKEYEREVLPEGMCGNVLQAFEDKPLGNDAWDIDIYYQEKVREITNLTKFEVTGNGALFFKVHMEYKYMNSLISQDMILYSNNRRIDFKTYVDCHEKNQLLKASFPVDIRSTYGTYDIQYGNVRRPNNWNTSWDQARFESVAHRWVDLSERNYGVSLLNDCKYGHDIKDNVMRITLIKTATYPDYLQDQGEHNFTYSLLPHTGDFIEGETVVEAFFVNEPMKAITGKIDLGYKSFISIDSELIEIDAIKKSESGDSIVIRFHEFAGSRQKVNVELGFSYSSWVEADLRERPIGTVSNEAKIQMELKPYEIKTILVWQ